MNKWTNFLLLVICLVCLNTAITQAQDFAFGGAGNSSNNFRNAIPIQLSGITKSGVSGANKTFLSNGTFLTTGYLNTFTNIASNQLPNGNDLSFNTLDVAIADVNADGFNDVLVVSDDNPSTQINAPNLPKGVLNNSRLTLFAGTGDGSFGLPISLNTSASPTSIAVADFNNDSLTDVLVGEIGRFEIFSTNLQTNSFKLLETITLPQNNRIASVDVKRINSDAFPDIIIALSNSTSVGGIVLVYASNTTGKFTDPPLVINTQGAIGFIGAKQIPATKAITVFQSNLAFPPNATLGKVDSDLDIAVATSVGLEVFENVTPQNSLTPAFEAVSVLFSGDNPVGVISGDLNNDQVVDLTIINQTSGTLTRYIANSTKPDYEPRKDFSVGKNLISASVANFDGDNQIDLLLVTPSEIVVLETNSTSGFTVINTFSFTKNGFPIFNPSAVVTGVLDTIEKGVSDIVIADGFSDSSNATSNLGSTGGVLVLLGALGYQPSQLRLFTSISQATDFDSVGRLNDLAIIEQTTGAVFLLNNISSTASPTVSIISIKDLFVNGEFIPTSVTTFVDPITGLNNLAITAVSNKGNVRNGLLIVAINDGSGSFNKPTQFRQFVATSGATSLRSGDFSNIGRASDLVYTDYLNNLVALTINDGRNFFLKPHLQTSKGRSPVSLAIADINDDDLMDVVVVNSIAPGIVPRQSLVTMLLNQGNAILIPVDPSFQVPGLVLSIVGGLGIIDNSFIPQIIDFNIDGFPDFVYISTSGGSSLGSAFVPTVNLLFSSKSGLFSSNSSISLFDDKAMPDGKNATGATLALDSIVGGAELVSGNGLLDSPLKSGFGGANQILSIGDFNADGSPDLVATGSIRTMQSLDGSNSLSALNYRASSYVTSNNTDNTSTKLRVVHPMRISEYTSNGDGTANLAVNAGDTFVGCAVGNFASFNNLALDVVHLSINGGLFIDANLTSILRHAPVVTIKRSDLNAPFPGGGRKVILTSGEHKTIPVTGFNLDDSSGKELGFSLVSNSMGVPPPQFIRLIDKRNGTADIVIDTINNGAGVNNSDKPIEFPIVVQCSNLGRPLLLGYSHFTLIVKPKSAPTIAPVANVNIDVGSSQTINLQVIDKDSSAITIAKKCDKDSYVSLNDRTLTIAPTLADIGANNCTITVTGVTGLFSSTTFNILVRNPNSPIITSVSFGNKQLAINGSKFGTVAKVMVNGKDVSKQILSQSDTLVMLKGNKKKLNLKSGANQLVITNGGLMSNTFVLNLLQNNE